MSYLSGFMELWHILGGLETHARNCEYMEGSEHAQRDPRKARVVPTGWPWGCSLNVLLQFSWWFLSKSFEWYSEQVWELEFPSLELIFLAVCDCLLFVWLVTLLKRAVLSCVIFHVCPLKLYSVCLWAYFDLEKIFLNTENH